MMFFAPFWGVAALLGLPALGRSLGDSEKVPVPWEDQDPKNYNNNNNIPEPLPTPHPQYMPDLNTPAPGTILDRSEHLIRAVLAQALRKMTKGTVFIGFEYISLPPVPLLATFF